MQLTIQVWAGSSAEAALQKVDPPARLLSRVYGRDRRLRSIWITDPRATFHIKDKSGKTLVRQD